MARRNPEAAQRPCRNRSPPSCSFRAPPVRSPSHSSVAVRRLPRRSPRSESWLALHARPANFAQELRQRRSAASRYERGSSGSQPRVRIGVVRRPSSPSKSRLANSRSSHWISPGSHMSERLAIAFAPFKAPLQPVAALLCAEELALGPETRSLDRKANGMVLRAAEAAAFKGKAKTSFELLAPAGLDVSRLIVIGAGQPDQAKETDWVNLGGYLYAQIAARKSEEASVVADLPDPRSRSAADIAADIAFGALLRSYRFNKYTTRQKDENGEEKKNDGLARLVVHTQDPEAAE